MMGNGFNRRLTTQTSARFPRNFNVQIKANNCQSRTQMVTLDSHGFSVFLLPHLTQGDRQQIGQPMCRSAVLSHRIDRDVVDISAPNVILTLVVSVSLANLGLLGLIQNEALKLGRSSSDSYSLESPTNTELIQRESH